MAVSRLDSDQILHSGREIDQLDQRITDAGARGNVRWWFDQERDVGQAVLERVLRLLDQAVVAGEIPVIGEEEHRQSSYRPASFSASITSPNLMISTRAHIP